MALVGMAGAAGAGPMQARLSLLPAGGCYQIP
jgi:hypothetical protein